jgi:hypothetical protein
MSNLGEHLDLRDVDAAGSEAFGHLQADVAGADNQTVLGLMRSRLAVRAKVSPIE